MFYVITFLDYIIFIVNEEYILKLHIFRYELQILLGLFDKKRSAYDTPFSELLSD